VPAYLELLRRRLDASTRLRARAEGAADPSLARLLRRGKTPSREREEEGSVRVLERRQLTPELSRLRLERPAGFDFEPGQYLRLRLAGMSRKYTVCSAPHEPWLELFVERQPGGEFTPHLFALREGDRVGVDPRASGSFTLARDAADHVMVATVTGVAPFVSMIRDAKRRGDAARFHVLHGASHADELGYAEELSRTPGVTYLPTVSRPDEPRNAGWKGATGRVGEHLEPYLEAHGLGPDRAVVYVCGNPEMVKDVRARMRERGYEVRDEDYG
jgi:ferredoxin-NADP reductase